ncbi:helix-turn-helix domain-containing protein [Candidatus Micrarchaeota archaeon]|nr:helix-turn-helix domain-containing protein [Candidatus Micrarchaeota archaeon]
MWIGRFKVWHKESVAMQASTGLDAQALTYYLGTYTEKGELHMSRVAYFEGPQKELFIKRFSKDHRVTIFRRDGDQLFYSLPASIVSHVETLDRDLFFVKPILVKDGQTFWTVASWDKRCVNRLYRKLKALAPDVRVHLESLTRGSLDLFLPHALVRMTGLQKNALELALQEGYFDFPRKMSLDQIAKKHKRSRTTLQSHLRKAEKKAMTALLGQGRF